MPDALRLADLDAPMGRVRLLSGREVTVRAIDGYGQDLREAFLAGEASDRDVWRLAGMLLPEATEAEIKALTPGMIAAVVEIAVGKLEAVLAYAKSRGFSEATVETPPPSDPEPGSAPLPPDSGASTAGSPTSA